MTHFTKDFFPSFPNECIECHFDQLVISTEELFEETEANAAASQYKPVEDPVEWYEGAVPENPPPQDLPDDNILDQLGNLNVAEHQLHIIPPQRPNLPFWPEDTIERRMEGLSTEDGGFTRDDSPLPSSGYCPHGYLIYREVQVDRFSCYDPPLYKPLAEECSQCCFVFLKKEMHEIRYGFIKRRNQHDKLTRNHVGPTMHRVRLQWQWIWAVMYKWEKFRKEFRLDRPPEGDALFEEELKCATEGGTIELPIKFHSGHGRYPGIIMRG